MKRSLIYFLLIALIGCSSKARTPKSVFVIIDGVPADVVERVHTPNIDEISARGGYARAYMGGEVGGITQTPTISAVCYTSLVTSTWVNKHNVWGNELKDPNYNYWNIFRIAKNQNREVKTAIFSSWEDNRTKLIGEGLEQAGAIYFDEVLDGLENDKEKFPDEPNGMNIFKVDEEISKGAALCIREKAPDVMWIYLWYMDSAGHIWGDGDEFDDFLGLADIQVGRIWDAVKEREKNHNEEWFVVITTDHGRTATDGKGHGGQTERERTTWISTNQEPNSYFKTKLTSITDIVPSISRFMGYKVPEDVEMEQEGVPFLGDISISNLTAKKNDDKIELLWDGWSNETVEIFLSTTNNFKEGKADSWESVGKAKAQSGKFVYDTKDSGETFYKFSVRGKHNNLPVWVVTN